MVGSEWNTSPSQGTIHVRAIQKRQYIVNNGMFFEGRRRNQCRENMDQNSPADSNSELRIESGILER